MNHIIQASGLIKHFGHLRAVDGIDFNIEEGESFGFLGPNGAGKTTTVRMINCFFPPSAGSLSICGLDVRRHPRKIKSLMGVAPQDDNLDPDFSVEKNLSVYARYYNLSREEVRRQIPYLLDLFKLGERRREIIEHLSGGMRKRLLLARSLINAPKILILDEPTTGLDPQARHLIWDKIRGFKGEGMTVILTTHYMEEAYTLCDRVAIMNDGKILEIDSPTNLILKYIGRRVAEIQVNDEVRRENVHRELRARGFRAEQFGSRVFVFLAGDDGPIFDDAHQTVRDANLEDVFLHLTGRELSEG